MGVIPVYIFFSFSILSSGQYWAGWVQWLGANLVHYSINGRRASAYEMADGGGAIQLVTLSYKRVGVGCDYLADPLGYLAFRIYHLASILLHGR